MEKRFSVRVQVTIESQNFGNDRLSISEDLAIQEMEFLDLCRVLGEFKSLVDSIRVRERMRAEGRL